MIVKNRLVNKIIVKNRTNLIDYFYFSALDIWGIDTLIRKPARQTRFTNTYNNKIGQECTEQGDTSQNQRALKHIL